MKFNLICAFLLLNITAFSQPLSDSLSYENIVPVLKDNCCYFFLELTEDNETLFYEIRSKNGEAKPYVGKMPNPHGNYYKYDSKKRITVYGTYEKGKEEGLFVYFDTTGTINGSSHFRKGLLNGQAKNYYSNGQLRLSTDFKDGLKDGEMLGFYLDGTRLFTGQYKKDKMIGQRMYYDVKGRPANGEMTWRHESGVVKLSGKCVNGQPDGRFTHYDENGIITLQVDYMNGIPHGKYIKYENGEVLYKNCYYLGKLQKTNCN